MYAGRGQGLYAPVEKAEPGQRPVRPARPHGGRQVSGHRLHRHRAGLQQGTSSSATAGRRHLVEGPREAEVQGQIVIPPITNGFWAADAGDGRGSAAAAETNIEPGFETMIRRWRNVLAWEPLAGQDGADDADRQAPLVVWGNGRVQSVADRVRRWVRLPARGAPGDHGGGLRHRWRRGPGWASSSCSTSCRPVQAQMARCWPGAVSKRHRSRPT